MKAGRVVLVIAGILVFLAVLIAYLPASWVASRLPPGLAVKCAEVNGSVWQGECVGLAFNGAKLGDATWNMGRIGALSRRFIGDIDLRGAKVNARADLDIAFTGTGEMHNVVSTLPLEPAYFPQLPADQRGVLSLDLKRATFDNAQPRTLEGGIELRDLRQVGARPLELGSYRVDFDGKPQPEGRSVGQLRDIGGPFAVEGTVTLVPPNGYLVQGLITGRTVEAERIVRDITLGAAPDTHGRAPFSFEGTY
jgi:hypothetical protein